jgi:hypothetical protein
MRRLFPVRCSLVLAWSLAGAAIAVATPNGSVQSQRLGMDIDPSVDPTKPVVRLLSSSSAVTSTGSIGAMNFSP